jgi:hypothetical protein
MVEISFCHLFNLEMSLNMPGDRPKAVKHSESMKQDKPLCR